MRCLVPLILLCFSCAPGAVQPAPQPTPPELPVIQGASYTGVIFSEEMAGLAVKSLGLKVSRVWTPTSEDVVRVESRLQPALEAARDAPQTLDAYSATSPERRAWMSRTIPKILEGLSEYRRQYIGIVASDRTRRILLNCFPGPTKDPDDFYAGWRQGLVLGTDGWYRYWRIQYNLDTDRFIELDPNGG